MASILVISDDPAVRAVLWQYLRHQGHEVSMVAEPAQALTTIREREPHVVLIDLDIAGLDGIEFLRQMRRSYPATAVAVMTEWGEPLAVPGLEPEWVLRKPCTREQVDAVLRKALG